MDDTNNLYGKRECVRSFVRSLGGREFQEHRKVIKKSTRLVQFSQVTHNVDYDIYAHASYHLEQLYSGLWWFTFKFDVA